MTQGVNASTMGHLATWFRADGVPLRNLPADFYHRGVYRRKGWTLVPPAPAREASPIADLLASMPEGLSTLDRELSSTDQGLSTTEHYAQVVPAHGQRRAW